MRRIFCLFLLIVGCDNGHTDPNPDLSAPDLSGGACTEGDKCTVTGGGKGVCHSGACGCVDTTDDVACDTAYSEPGKHYICSSGACVIGCRTANDCGGQLCGLTTANTCGPCTTDAQCAMALGAGHICNPTSGACVSSDCATAGTACVNPGDFCCAAAGGGSNSCVTGNCCSSSDCMGGQACVNHTCTSCPSPSPGILVVDPSDTGTAPTGADVAGCRYKTITAAMNVISGPGTIQVLGSKTITGSNACTDATIECYPIAVKSGVNVVGASPAPTIQVASGQTGFSILSGSGMTLSNLVLDGADNTNAHVGQLGILVQASPSPSPAARIDHVTAKNFARSGIQVNGGQLDVRDGTMCTNNEYGLELRSTFAAASMSTAGDQISMSNNSQAGVYILKGAFSATGTPGQSGAGTVVFNQNGSGLLDDQGVASGAGSQTVVVNGVAMWKNSTGVSITAGTPIQIRSCYILGSTVNGIDISGNNVNDPTSGIDIGNAANGHNTLQDSDAIKKNAGAGVCNHQTGTVEAQGNVFRGIDCSGGGTPGTLTFSASDCTGAVDYGFPGGGAVHHNNCNP